MEKEGRIKNDKGSFIPGKMRRAHETAKSRTSSPKRRDLSPLPGRGATRRAGPRRNLSPLPSARPPRTSPTCTSPNSHDTSTPPYIHTSPHIPTSPTRKRSARPGSGGDFLPKGCAGACRGAGGSGGRRRGGESERWRIGRATGHRAARSHDQLRACWPAAVPVQDGGCHGALAATSESDRSRARVPWAPACWRLCHTRDGAASDLSAERPVRRCAPSRTAA